MRTPLRAEEENFSVGVDDEEEMQGPNSFLMEQEKMSLAEEAGPSSSPLR